MRRCRAVGQRFAPACVVIVAVILVYVTIAWLREERARASGSASRCQSHTPSRDGALFAMRSSVNVAISRDHWSDWAKQHIFNTETIDNATVAHLKQYATRKQFPNDQMYDAKADKWIDQERFCAVVGIEKAFEKATGESLSHAMQTACAAYQNGAHYVVPEGLSPDVTTALMYKMAPFLTPLNEKTPLPLIETRCVETPKGVRIVCGTEESEHRFRPGAFEELRRCVGPWSTDHKNPVTSCAKVGTQALYFGDDCEVPTKLGRLAVQRAPPATAPAGSTPHRVEGKAKAPVFPGACHPSSFDNPYIEWQQHVVPMAGASMTDIMQKACARVPACDLIAAGSDGITCAKGRYGKRCHMTFDAEEQVLNNCIAGKASLAFNVSKGCKGKTGKFVVDAKGAISDLSQSQDRSLQSQRQNVRDRMSSDCKCIYPFFSEKGRSDCMKSLLPGVVNDIGTGRPAGCYNPSQYGANCQYTLTGAQTLDTSGGRAAALDPSNVRCPVAGLSWNFEKREDGNASATTSDHGLWKGCTTGTCDPVMQVTGSDCDVRCPIGSAPDGGDTCVCKDKHSNDHGIAMKATSDAEVNTWKGKRCSSNCKPGYVGDMSHECIKCPARLAARDNACFCDDPSRLDYGSAFSLASMHAGILQRPSSEHFCQTCAHGHSGADCGEISAS